MNTLHRMQTLVGAAGEALGITEDPLATLVGARVRLFVLPNISPLSFTYQRDLILPVSPYPGSSERSVKVSGSREEVTQCIYHICCALLDSPPKGDPRLYRPDGGFSDNRGFGGGGGSGSRGRERDSYRRERSPPGFGGGADYSNSFEAIADFARRQRGGRSRDDSRDRDQRYEMSVPNDVVGAVIGKRGSKINEIRQISGATINIMETGQQKKGEKPRHGQGEDHRDLWQYYRGHLGQESDQRGHGHGAGWDG